MRIVRIAALVLIATAGLGLASSASAQQLYVYPAQGQTQEQLDQDRYECHVWAVQQTGYDPANPGASSQAQASSSGGGGEVVRGAARGAALGAAVGAVRGDAGEGAAAGAAGGAVVGLFRRHDNRRRAVAEQEAYQQQASSGAQTAYNQAQAACLQGRGYTVN